MISAVLFAVLCVAVPAMQGASIMNSVSVVKSGRGAVPFALSGYVDGGVARIADIRFPGCSSTPCQVSQGQQINLEIDFIPRDMHSDLSQRGILMKEAQLVELSDERIPDSTVQPGQSYTIRYPFTVNTPFNGLSEFRIKVYQNYVMEVLLSIPLNIG